MAGQGNITEDERLFTILPDMLCIAGFDGYFKKLNPAWGKTVGYTNDELKARPFIEFVHPDDRQTTIAELQKLTSGSLTISFTNRYICKDGSSKWLSWSATPVIEQKLIWAIARDITDRKLVEEELRDTNEKLQAIVDASPLAIVALDLDAKVMMWSPAAERIFGWSEQEVIGQFVPLVPRNKQNEFRAAFNKVVQESGYHSQEVQSLRKDGTPIDSCFSTAPLHDAERNVIGIVAIIDDITGGKQAEEELRQSEQKYHILIDNIQDGLFIDQEGKFVYVNEPFAKMVGYAVNELTGMDFRQIVAPEDLEMVADRHRRRQAGENPPREYELRVLHKDGSRITLNMTVWPINYRGSYAAMGTLKNITERMRAEEEIRSSREQLRNLYNRLQYLREEERTFIAREIHDELGQQLSMLQIDLARLEDQVPKNKRTMFKSIRSLGGFVDNIIQSVRRIATELRPSLLDDFGLSAAVEWQAKEFQSRTGIQCHVTLNKDEIVIGRDQSTVIYRIFQEALTNVFRHAQATKVEVCLMESGEKIRLEIRDNGRGICDSEITSSKSLGLIGMKERVRALDGHLEICGTPAQGTTVIVSLPHGKKG